MDREDKWGQEKNGEESHKCYEYGIFVAFSLFLLSYHSKLTGGKKSGKQKE